MTKFYTCFLLFTIGIVCSSQGQTIVQDFEPQSNETIARFGASVSIVSNPSMDGNPSPNVARIGRTTANWFELIAFNTDSYTVPAGETMYLHVWVNYPAQPDVSVRFDVATADGNGGTDVRALNTITEFGVWQDLVFQLDGGDTGATVTAILYLDDLGFQNGPEPSGNFVLNNSDAFAYVDQFRFTDSPDPETNDVLDIDEVKTETSFALYPNPANTFFKIDNITNVSEISLYSLVGNHLRNWKRIEETEFGINDLTPGTYIVRVVNKDGDSTSRLFIKK